MSRSSCSGCEPTKPLDPKTIACLIWLQVLRFDHPFHWRFAIACLRVFRPELVAGGGEEELPVPAKYHVAYPGLSPAAVDTRGRILVPVVPKNGFYYQTAILDPAAKSFTLVPMVIDGDAGPAGWTPDGRILARGKRYLSSLWRYQRSRGFK